MVPLRAQRKPSRPERTPRTWINRHVIRTVVAFNTVSATLR
jgi:hypothetical protein